MAFRKTCVALILASLPVAGCGTVANTVVTRPEQGGKVPFGGVREDVRCIKTAANGEVNLGLAPWSAEPDHKLRGERNPQLGLLLLCAADLPFSMVGDIVTWPYTWVYSRVNEPIPTPPVVIQAPVEARVPAPVENRPQKLP
ncbi:MAG TPA: hypothetical protein VGE74_27900 [Gemmata sp.]